MALPFSLDGRHPIDYYRSSVTLGLAPRRRSHVPFSAGRFERDVGAPSIPLNWFATNRLPCGENEPQNSNGSFMAAPPIGTVAMSVRFHHWRLGFRQSGFHHIARALQDHILSAFRCLPLF